MAHYLVTGGCGFIGSHLVKALLEKGDRVRILDNLATGQVENVPEACEMIIGDVADRVTVARAMDGIDGCFHLAAVASKPRSNEVWYDAHRINLSGTINIFDAARRPKSVVPVVYASSAAVYGDNATPRLKENDTTHPLNTFAADKLGCELHARAAFLMHGVPTTGFRIFNVYGPRQDPKSLHCGVISLFTDRIQDNLPLIVHGNGHQVRDFIHISDVVTFLLAGMNRMPSNYRVFNLCTGQPTAIKDLALTLFSIFGQDPDIRHVPSRPGEIRTSVGDPTFAAKMLGVKATLGIVEGLRQTLPGWKPSDEPPSPQIPTLSPNRVKQPRENLLRPSGFFSPDPFFQRSHTILLQES
ncbi:MAG: NAD-dependent epimerase/dehydratase family protein [Magnetococcales bacterium]|nr:NAD-dependent epimerase/dehydratase family protein [Magnetococcales bacterium]